MKFIIINKSLKTTLRVLRKSYHIFRRGFMEIGYIQDFLESFTIASAYNILRERFFKPDTICLIPDGGYCFNNNYSKKALMWLLHMENTDDSRIMHARIGCGYRQPEHSKFSVDG